MQRPMRNPFQIPSRFLFSHAHTRTSWWGYFLYTVHSKGCCEGHDTLRELTHIVFHDKLFLVINGKKTPELSHWNVIGKGVLEP